MMAGFFITFEGGEGVGKTTQINHLEKYLRDNGHDIVRTREPGGTPAAEEIRGLLSHKTHGGTWTPEAEVMLLFAARAMHIHDVIAPAIEAGKIIICDRYIDSTRVYQGYLQGMDMKFIESLEAKIVGPYIPNLTFVMDVPYETAMARVKSRGGDMDHYDLGNDVFYKGLQDGFLEIAKNNPDRCVVINAEQNEKIIAAHIAAIVSEKVG